MKSRKSGRISVSTAIDKPEVKITNVSTPKAEIHSKVDRTKITSLTDKSDHTVKAVRTGAETNNITDTPPAKKRKHLNKKYKLKNGVGDINGFRHEKKTKYNIKSSDMGDEKSVADVGMAVETVQGLTEAAKTAAKAPAAVLKAPKQAVSAVKNGAKSVQTGFVKTKLGAKKLSTAFKTGNGLRYSGKLAVKAGKAVTTGSIKTAVSITKKGASAIHTSVVNQTIDKSKVTDTGIEAMKQGAEYLRYAENAKTFAGNTIKTAKNIKNTPHNIKVAAKKIKNTPQNIKKAAEKAKKAAKVIGSIFKSKATFAIMKKD